MKEVSLDLSGVLSTEGMTALLGGDSEAWEQIYNHYHPRLVRFCSNYVKSKDEAEDIVQDTFIKVKQKAHTFKEGSKLRPWLYQIARNTALDHLRKYKKQKPMAGVWGNNHFASTTRIEIPADGPSPATVSYTHLTLPTKRIV